MRCATGAALALACCSSPAGPAVDAAATTAGTTARNRSIVAGGFDMWARTGAGIFDLLADDVRWTIAGTSPSARTLDGRAAFLHDAVEPLSARLAGPIRPTVRALVAEGDTVVVRWDGVAPLKDGQTYRNSYAWFLMMRDGKVIAATAFLDLPTYDAALAGRRLPDRAATPPAIASETAGRPAI